MFISSRPLFQRSPREFPSFPTEEVEIQSPPPIPSRPTSSVMGILLPSLGMVFGVILSIVLALFASSTGGYSLIGLAITVPMMVGSVAAGLYNYNSERKKYHQSVKDREYLYQAHLNDCRNRLTDLAKNQCDASLRAHPTYATCMAIVRRQRPEDARHLWERSSGLERSRDPDFLHLRLGTGSLPATFKAKPPSSPQQVGERDELYDQAVQLAKEFQNVRDVAVPLPLAQVGSAGLAGPRDSILDSTRALLVQLATLHAPNEVKVIALLPAHELAEWDWLRWLPHVWDDERKNRYIATTPDQARQLLSSFFPILQRRSLSRSASQDEKTVYPQTYVFIFADPSLYSATTDTSVIGPFMHLLLTQGKEIGGYSLFLNERPEALPSACGAIVDLNKGSGCLRLMGPPTVEIALSQRDAVNDREADSFARTLAPVCLKPLSTPMDLPSNVTLLGLLKAKTPQDATVQAFWQARDSNQSLETPIGIDAGGGVVNMNLQDAAHHGDGSHAMIGGTTGTGKTRFLQTMITLLAVHHHPHDVNFVLIDYKGGDLLQGLENLPHVVGTLANLEKQNAQSVLIERLFVCLESELRRRRNLLGRQGINEYQREFQQGKHPHEPLPHLFVVIDEFAEMIRNSPDKATMTKRLSSIGATGRSLGVHLILATQDPSGVVNDELRNNINIRICLRMGSRDASMAILRLPDAYEKITGAQVGRACLQVGNNDRFTPFQVAWGGEKYTPGQAGGTMSIVEVSLEGKRTPLHRFMPILPANETQLGALVDHICQTAKSLGLDKLKSPLSPPLRETIPLDELRRGAPGWNGQDWEAVPQSDWLAPVVGEMDDPSNQAQDPLRLPIGKEGHLALYGEPGSGKTTFIQTFVTSLALSHPPADLYLYLLDFSGQRLLGLKGFPHVGDVFTIDDIERIKRYFRFLGHELQDRKAKFGRLGLSNLYDYRVSSGEALPAIITVLKDYATFSKTCVDRNLDLDDILAGLVRDGSSYGLHFVLAMTSPSELKSRLANCIALASTFHLATPDYSMVVGPTAGLEPAALPGRGLVKAAPPLEFQTALPVQGCNDAERAQSLSSLMQKMDGSWKGSRPPAFPPIPATLGLSTLVIPGDHWQEIQPADFSVTFALSYDDPDRTFTVNMQDGPYFLVAGTPQSGKTTLLQAWTLALGDRISPQNLILYLVDFRRSGLLPLSELPQVTSPMKFKGAQKGRPKGKRYITNEDHFGLAIAEISDLMQKRQDELEIARQKSKAAFDLRTWIASQPMILLVMDDLDVFQSDVLQQSLKDLLDVDMKKWRDLGFAIIAAGPVGEIENAWGWIAQMRSAPVGFQLGTAAYNQVFKINNLPADNLAKHLLPGDAFFIRRGQFQRVKIADPQIGPIPLASWVDKIVKRS